LTPTVEPKEAVKRIRAHCRGRLAAYKTPVKIEVVDAKLTSDRQKAQRRESDRT
jgi:acyl-CoA synthetase (AMP-forming)/AMP-acid ligase II